MECGYDDRVLRINMLTVRLVRLGRDPSKARVDRTGYAAPVRSRRMRTCIDQPLVSEE